MNSIFRQLSMRLDLIESTHMRDNPENLIQRLQTVDCQIVKIEKEYPELKSSIEVLIKIYPIMFAKINILKNTLEKANIVQSRKEFIEQQIVMLQSITSSHNIVNQKEFSNTETLKELLDKVNFASLKLQSTINNQTVEVDEILQLYEQSTLYVSKAIESWDFRLGRENA